MEIILTLTVHILYLPPVQALWSSLAWSKATDVAVKMWAQYTEPLSVVAKRLFLLSYTRSWITQHSTSDFPGLPFLAAQWPLTSLVRCEHECVSAEIKTNSHLGPQGTTVTTFLALFWYVLSESVLQHENDALLVSELLNCGWAWALTFISRK